MSPANKHRRIVLLTLVCDFLAIAVSFITAYGFRFLSGLIPLDGSPPEIHAYFKALLVTMPIYVLFFRAYGLYTLARHIRRIEEIFLVIKGVTFSIVVLMASTFFYRDFSYSRLFLIVLWFFSSCFISFSRYLLIQWEYRRKIQKKDISKILIIGANRSTRNIVQWAQHNPHYGKQVIGILGHETSDIGKHFEDAPILGTILDYEAMIEKLVPDEVILVDTAFSREKITELVVFCEDKFISFKVGADIYGLMTQNVDVEYISSVPLLGFRDLPLDDVWNRFLKRVMDVFCALVILFFSSPVWLVTILLMKLTDRGTIFYKQERVGRDQKVFNVLKFRTMKADAEKETGPVWAKPGDNRRTWLGQFLRRWNIDELPQLFNVLRGDMSLVGPRPERPHFVNQFRETIPRYMARHKIKSGLTGWAQVNGYRGDTSIQERIKYDLYYMENWSILLDIEILFRTLFSFKNAY